MSRVAGSLSFQDQKKTTVIYLEHTGTEWWEVKFKSHDEAKAYAKKHKRQFLPPTKKGK